MAGIKKTPLPERFWSKVDKTGDCWEWRAAFAYNGYGRFRLPEGHVSAHVMAYQLTHGAVPTGLEVHHECENRSCVNPRHLRAVTHHENLLASATLPGINARKTHCLRGHAFDSTNTYVTSEGKRKCRACRHERRQIRAGNIGEPQRTVEFEPLTTTPAPVEAPAPAVAPEPEQVPA